MAQIYTQGRWPKRQTAAPTRYTLGKLELGCTGLINNRHKIRKNIWAITDKAKQPLTLSTVKKIWWDWAASFLVPGQQKDQCWFYQLLLLLQSVHTNPSLAVSPGVVLLPSVISAVLETVNNTWFKHHCTRVNESYDAENSVVLPGRCIFFCLQWIGPC